MYMSLYISLKGATLKYVYVPLYIPQGRHPQVCIYPSIYPSRVPPSSRYISLYISLKGATLKYVTSLSVFKNGAPIFGFEMCFAPSTVKR